MYHIISQSAVSASNIKKIMLSKITLENFFSFKNPTTIKLNRQVNILLGINGSGKSGFLKAINLLYESIVGKGLEKVFLTDWGGFDIAANFNQNEKDYIKLTFEFDKDALKDIATRNGYKGKNRHPEEISKPSEKLDTIFRQYFDKLDREGKAGRSDTQKPRINRN